MFLCFAVEEHRIYRAGGWVEFNRVNGEWWMLVSVVKSMVIVKPGDGGRWTVRCVWR